MSDDLKLVVTSDSTAARKDISRLEGSVSGLKLAALKAAEATGSIGDKGAANITKMVPAVNSATSSMSGLVGVAATLATTLAAVTSTVGFYKLADSITLMQNKLRLVTKDTGEMLAAQNDLYTISKKSNTALEATVALYSSLSKAAAQGYKGSTSMLRITETIQKAVTISGASADSANAAIMQLNQGLSSGVLRGEELNSVLEQTPRVAQAIADGLNITIGALREMGAAGKLSTQVVIDALSNQSGKIDSEFGKTAKTTENAILRMTTAFKLLVNEIDVSLGMTNRFVSTLEKMADKTDGASQSFGASFASMRADINHFIFAVKKSQAANSFRFSFLENEYQINDILSPMGKIEAMMTAINSATYNGDHRRSVWNTYEQIDSVAKALSFYQEKLRSVSVITQVWNDLLAKNPFLSKPDKLPMSVVLSESMLVFANMTVILQGFIEKLSTIAPIIKGPITDAASSVATDIANYGRIMLMSIQSVARPVKRTLQAIFETATFGLFVDNGLERSFVRLFRSKDIIAFNDALQDIGESLNSTRGGDWMIRVSDWMVSIRSVKWWAQDVLMSLELMDNRLIALDNIRFDRIQNFFEILGSIITAVYGATIKTPLEQALIIYKTSIRNFFRSLLDALIDSVVDLVPQEIGQSLAKSILSALDIVVSYLKDTSVIAAVIEAGSRAASDAMKGKFDPASWFSGDVNNVFSNIFDTIKNIVLAFAQFMNGFFSTLFGGAVNGAVNSFDKLVLKVSSAADKLNKDAMASVKRFTEGVEKAFFHAYDVVVGHSYWPDLINEVTSWSRKLKGEAIANVEKFVSMVSDKFKGAGVSIASIMSQATTAIFSVAAALSILFVASGVVSVLFSGIGAMFGYVTGTATLAAARMGLFQIALLPISGLLSGVGVAILSLGRSLGLLTMAMGFVALMFPEIPKLAAAHLGQAGVNVEAFADRVKKAFFVMYDEIVGHSYWPDTIQGVIDESQRLMPEAGSAIEKFQSVINNIFAGIREKSKGLFEAGVQKFKVTASTINFASISDGVSRAVSTGITAALLLTFGGTVGLTLVSSMLFGAVTKGFLLPMLSGIDSIFGVDMPKQLGETLGTGLAILIKHMYNAILSGIDLISQAVPSFVESFLNEFGLIGKSLHYFISEFTMGTHGMLFTLLFGTLGLAGYNDGFKGVMSKTKEIASFIGGVFAYKKPSAPDMPYVPPAGMGVGTGLSQGVSDQASKIKTAVNKAVENKDKGSDFFSFKLFGATANPALLLTGIGLVQAAVTGSIDTLQGLAAGVPILAFALLGKDAGARLIEDSKNKLWDGISAMFQKVQSMTGMANSASANFGMGIGNALWSGIVTPSRELVGGMFSNLGKIFSNITRYRDEYAAGSVGFYTLIFGDKNDGTATNFVGDFKAAIEKIKLGAQDVKKEWASIAAKAADMWSTISGATEGKWGSIKEKLGSIFAPVASAGADVASMLKDMWGKATEGMKGATTGMASNISGIASAAGGATGLIPKMLVGVSGMAMIAAIGAAIYAMFGGMQSAVDSVNDSLTTTNNELLDALILVGKIAAIMAIVDALIIGISVGIKSGIAAGLIAAVSSFATKMNLLSGITLAIGLLIEKVYLLAAAMFTASKGAAALGTVSIWTSMANVASLAFKSVASGMSALWLSFGGTVATLASRATMGMAAMSAQAGILTKIFVSLQVVVRTLVFTFTRGLGVILSGLGSVVAGLAGVGLTAGMVIAGLGLAAGVGILTVMMFGKGDGFFQKLSYAGDWLKSIASGTPLGAMEASVVDPRAKSLMNKLPNTELGGKKYNFADKLRNIDYDNLPTAKYEKLVTLVDKAAQSIADVKNADEDFSSMLPGQQKNLDNTTLALDRYIAQQGRLPNVLNATMVAQERFISAIEGESVSFMERFGVNVPKIIEAMKVWKYVFQLKDIVMNAIFGPGEGVITRTRKAISGFFTWMGNENILGFKQASAGMFYFLQASEAMWKDVKTFASDGATSIAKSLGMGASTDTIDSMRNSLDGYKVMFASLNDLEPFLNNTDIEEKNAAINAVTDSFIKLRAVESLGASKSMEEWKLRNDEFQKAKQKLDELAGRQFAKGKEQAEIKYYQDLMLRRAKMKDLVGLGDGNSADKVLGIGDFLNLDQGSFLANLSEQMTAARDKLAAGVASDDKAIPLRVEIRNLEEQQKKLYDWMNKGAFLDQRFDLEIQLTGLEVTKQQLYEFYEFNEEGYNQWAKAVDRLKAAELAREGLSFKSGDRNEKRRVLREVEEARKAVEASAPAKGIYAEVNAMLGKLNIGTLTNEQFLQMGDSVLVFKKKLDEAVAAQDNLGKMKGDSRSLFEPQRLALGQLSNKIAEVKREADSIGKSATKTLVDQLSEAGIKPERFISMTEEQRSKAVTVLRRSSANKDAMNQAINNDTIGGTQSLGASILTDNKLLSDMGETKSASSSGGSAEAKKTVFDKFSELTSKAGINVTIEQFSKLGIESKRVMMASLNSAVEIVNSMARFKSLDIVGNEGFETSMANLERIRKEGADILETLPDNFSDAMSKAMDGSAFKMADVFALPEDIQSRVAEYGMQLAKIADERSKLTSKDIGKANDLNRREEYVKGNREALLSGSAAFRIKAPIIAEQLGITLDDKALIDLTDDQIAKLSTLGGRADAVMEKLKKATTTPEWIAGLKEKGALSKEANSILKTSLSDRLTAIGLDGIDLSNLELDITKRNELIGVIDELSESYSKYMLLKKQAANGTISPEDAATLAGMNRARAKPKSIAAKADIGAPIKDVGALLTELKLDMSDLVDMPMNTLMKLQESRRTISGLYEDIRILGVDDLGLAKQKSIELNKQMQLEKEITDQIADRKSLMDGFQSSFADGFKAIFHGTGTWRQMWTKVQDTIADTYITKVSNKAMGGMSKYLSKSLTPEGGLLNSITAPFKEGGKMSFVGSTLSKLYEGTGASGLVDTVKGSFGEGGMLSGVGGLFRSGGMLESVGGIFSDIFGGSEESSPLGSKGNAMYVRILEGNAEGSLLGDVDKAMSDPLAYIEEQFAGADIGSVLSDFTSSFEKVDVGSLMGNLFGGSGGMSGMLSGLFGGGGGMDFSTLAMKGIGALFGLPMFDKGGVVGGQIGAPQLALVHSGETIFPTHKRPIGDFINGKMPSTGGSTTVHLNITGDISRQTRKEIMQMIPQIATGVNSSNRENNIRR